MSILIKGGRVIDPGKFDGIADVLIENGQIVALGSNLSAPVGGRTIEATRKLVVPGFVDVHVHFREPDSSIRKRFRAGVLRRLRADLQRCAVCPTRTR